MNKDTMSVHISRNSMQKLTHHSIEIRLRTLEQIESKFLHAMTQNCVIEFKPVELCKQLIRWFGCQPLLEPKKALSLLNKLLRSNYGDQITSKLGLERIRREMDKVKHLLKLEKDAKVLLDAIEQHLHDEQCKQDINELIETTETLNINSNTGCAAGGDSAIPDAANKISNEIFVTSRLAVLATDYEVAWSKPNAADYNTMKLLADLLVNKHSSREEMENALQHLQITMLDYPAEYLLQAPHIYCNLLSLFNSTNDVSNNGHLENIAETLMVYLKLLKNRITMAYSTLSYTMFSRTEEVEGKTQLKIEKALHLIMTSCLQQMEQQLTILSNDVLAIFDLVYVIIELYKMQQLLIDPLHIEKIGSMSLYLKKDCNNDEHLMLAQHKYLILTDMLINVSENNASRQPLMQEINFLKMLLSDYNLQMNFPNHIDRVKHLISNSNPKIAERFEEFIVHQKCFTTAIALLKAPESIDKTALLEIGNAICFTIHRLKSLKLTEILFNALVECNIYYSGNDELKCNALQLLQHLINLPSEVLKSFVYNKFAVAIKKHFACMMNSEFYASGISNSILLEAQIIGLPWNTELIMEIIYEGFQSEHMQVRETCECILLLLLKSQHLLDKHWSKFLQLLLPMLPLLQCFSHSSKITERLMELFHPDAGNVPLPYVLRSNILFLFYKDNEIRSEALTRVLYIIQSLANANDFVPNILEIQDILPNDLLLMETPKDIKYIFNVSDNFSDLSTLHNLLAILQSTDIEPLIRKTTLVQLNVLCQNWELLEAFCNDGAYYLVLHTLEHALKKVTYTDYTDAVLPAVSILNKVLMYDVSLRLELACVPNIYVLLMRSLFLYSNNIQMRQEATLCLFQLIFASFIHVNSVSGIVELPIVLRNLQVPFKCTYIVKHTSDSYETNNFKEIFATPALLQTYLRFHIAASYAGDYFKIKKKHLELQKELDICSELMITSHDYTLIRCSMPLANLRRCLQMATSATEHTALLNACVLLKTQFILYSSWSMTLTNCRAVITKEVHDLIAELYKMLSKYLHLPPGNDMDFILYEELLMLCYLCIRLDIAEVIQGLSLSLQMDFQHAFITLLKDANISLRFYRRLCGIIYQLLLSSLSFKDITPNSATPAIFFSNLFDLVFEIALQLFEQRDLQRVRCLLSLLQALSRRYLDMPDKLLGYYCKRFIRMSVALKSFTQTGAQWQRDCLMLVCQLYTQMAQPEQELHLNAKLLKYFSALCCHVDAQIRGLSWTLLTFAATAAHNSEAGLFTFLTELAYLPGGFMACCLSTFLDTAELGLVRELAGNLLIILSTKATTFGEINKLLEQHNFYRQAHEALDCVNFNIQLPNHFDIMSGVKLTTSGIISCYCRMFIALIDLQPDSVVALCEKPFMHKVYELIKLPDSAQNNSSYEMCSYICQLYAKCYNGNFIFLQRSLCRDQLWLTHFMNLLNVPIRSEKQLINVLQLLLVLCKDSIAYQKICELFYKDEEILVRLFKRVFHIQHIDTCLQRTTLALLSLLLIKSQKNEDIDKEGTFSNESYNFVDILERPTKNLCNRSVTPTDSERNKENIPETSNKSLKAATATLKQKKSFNELPEYTADSLAAFCFIELSRIFQHLYPIQACKFKATPSIAQQQVAETLSVLLKLSTQAQQAADHLKLLDKLIKILQSFFEDCNMSCTTFVRRFGDGKKQPIIKHFQLLTQLLLNWFSSPAAIIKEEPLAFELTKLMIQIWPWLAHSGELKIYILQLCAYLSERSLVVCQQFSTLIGNYANSILQLVLKIVMHDTSCVKAASTQWFPTIAIGIRVLMNCCACMDGRVTLVKCHVLDVFDGLYPFNLKSPKIKHEILHSWLEFWELFSRYTEGAALRNLNALCGVINRTSPRSITRLLTLKILRNMSFLSSNRSALMVSTDFIFTINEVISQPMLEMGNDLSYAEQMHASVIIWKIISGGVKYIAQLRGTKLAKQLQILRENLASIENEEPTSIKSIPYAYDLSNILDIIFSIFSSK